MTGQAPDRPYTGRLVGGTHRFALRVYYEDTDAGGIVYHANYLRYFERARTDMMALVGVDHVAALGSGAGSYVVAAATLRYLAPARLGDALVVVSALVEARGASCVVQQRVSRDDALLVDGRLTLAFVAPDGQPRRQPGAWIEAFRAAAGNEAAA